MTPQPPEVPQREQEWKRAMELLERAAAMLPMLADRAPNGHKNINEFADEIHEFVQAHVASLRPHRIGVWDYESAIDCLKHNWEEAFPGEPFQDAQDAIQRMAATIVHDRALVPQREEAPKPPYRASETNWNPADGLPGYESRINAEGYKETRPAAPAGTSPGLEAECHEQLDSLIQSLPYVCWGLTPYTAEKISSHFAAFIRENFVPKG